MLEIVKLILSNVEYIKDLLNEIILLIQYLRRCDVGNSMFSCSHT